MTYHASDVPDGGPAIGNLQGILDKSASDQQRGGFADALQRRVQVVISGDSLFTVEAI